MTKVKSTTKIMIVIAALIIIMLALALKLHAQALGGTIVLLVLISVFSIESWIEEREAERKLIDKLRKPDTGGL